MKKHLIFLVLLTLPVLVNANNFKISNISVSLPNVTFTIEWENSWNTTNNINPLYPNNWDGVWLFVKYQNNIDNLWKHAVLSTSAGDHSITGGVLEINTVSDGMGVFVRRSAPGAGNITATTVTLRMNALAGTGNFNFRVFGTEMVYMPRGEFQLGDGQVSGVNYFSPITIDSAKQANGIASGALYSGSPAVPAAFPMGFNACYMMKYEITCEQWADFMNTLTFDQQANRMDFSPTNAANSAAYNNGGVPQYSNNDDIIRIKTSGLNNTRPAELGCDFNGNGVFNETADGQNIAVSMISRDDLLAYLDWSGLRPMTEMEFEKACRGTLGRVSGEYAWGSTAIAYRSRNNIQNSGTPDEASSASVVDGQTFGNANVNSSLGPSRAGVFATTSSGRASSGAGFYGAMELSGNALEQTQFATAGGVSFNGAHGNGALAANGSANVTGWNIEIYGRGGEWYYPGANAYLQTSFRAYGAIGGRSFVYGGRGVRTAP